MNSSSKPLRLLFLCKTQSISHFFFTVSFTPSIDLNLVYRSESTGNSNKHFIPHTEGNLMPNHSDINALPISSLIDASLRRTYFPILSPKRKFFTERPERFNW